MIINRRKLLGALTCGAGVLGLGLSRHGIGTARAAQDALVEAALSAGEKQVVFAGGTGSYGERVAKYFIEPFSKETGIKVISAGGSYGEKLAKLKAMQEVGRVEWDIVTLSRDALVPTNAALLRDLGSCGDLPAVAANGVAGSCQGAGVLFDIGAGVMLYSNEVFPDGKPQPSSWADFWDVDKFPGPRALPNFGNPWWVLIAALQADGVAADALFPLDLDRAFKKLDEIKPHVTVWWKSGDQSQQIWRGKEVVMATMYQGRALGLKNEGLPVNLSFDGAPLDAAVWCATKNAPHPKAALALLNYAYTRPEAHAAFTKESFGATANKDAVALLDPDLRKLMATNPDNWAGIVQIDRDWLAGNAKSTIKRWTEWVAG